MAEGIDVAEGGGEEQTTGARSGTADVFISHASQDAAIANAVVAVLESQGIHCWIAPRDVTPGEFYADAIVHAIDAAVAVVLVLSQNASASPHIMREVERASSKRHPVISLRIDRAPLPAGLEYFLNTSQWLDASDGEPSRVFPKLVEAIRRVLTGGPAPHAADQVPALPSPRPALDYGGRRRVVAIVVALVVVALVAIATDKLWLSKHTDEATPKAAATPAVTAMPATQPMLAEPMFAPPPHSIAVLPFVNMSGDAKQDYFSDGITEELLNSLSRLNELQVVARTSSFSFKGQNVDVSTIAHKLNVSAILEGSVRRSGNTVRITAQLINAVTGFHIWSQTYDRNITDILKVQTEVASSVAKQLEVQLVANEVARIELGGTNSAQAYDAYLRGAQLLAGLDQDESVLRAALSEFERAISLDPEYAAAYAQRARTLDYMSIFVASPTGRPGLRRQAREAAERAVALSPEFGEAHLELAQVRAYGLLDFRGALPEFDHALALAPGSARVQRAFAGFASSLGHFEQATIAAGRAIRLDPRNAESYSQMAQVNYDARRYGEALIAFQHVKALSPRSHYIEGWIIMSLIASGQIERARQDCEALPTLLDEDDRHYCLALVYHALGRQADGERELKKLKGIDEDHSAYTCATIYAQWGNKAEALRWLAKAEQLLDPGLQDLRVNWTLDPIRNEPEFKAIEARMNFPP